MLRNKRLQQVFNAIGDELLVGLSFFCGGVSALHLGGEYLLGCEFRLMESDATRPYGPIVYFRSRALYMTINTLRPFGVIFTPKPGRPTSQ
jgi:hypothetical protein